MQKNRAEGVFEKEKCFIKIGYQIMVNYCTVALYLGFKKELMVSHQLKTQHLHSQSSRALMNIIEYVQSSDEYNS